MENRNALLSTLLSLSLVTVTGCGCPCPQTPSQPQNTQTSKKPSPSAFATIGQCADTAEDEELQMQIVDDLGIISLSPASFVDLDPHDRVIAYHLAKAVAASSSLAFEQRSSFGPTLKQMAEELALHSRSLEESQQPKVQAFLRSLFIHRGMHDAWTGTKIPPLIDEKELRSALETSFNQGAKLPGVRTQADIGTLIDKLRPALFDPNVEPLTKKYISWGPTWASVLPPLNAASKLASPEFRNELNYLSGYLEKGSPDFFSKYLQASPSTFQLLLAPCEPRKEAWNLAVMLEDKDGQASLDKLAAISFDMEGLFPQPMKMHAVTAGIPLVFAGAPTSSMALSTAHDGSGGARTWVAFPMVDALGALHSKAVLGSFMPNSLQKEQYSRCLRQAYRIRTVLGHFFEHAITSEVPGLADGTLPKLRAELLTLIASWDPMLLDSGWLSGPTCVDVVGALAPIEYLLGLRGIGTSLKVQEPGLKALSILVNVGVERGAIREEVRDGQVHFILAEQATWKAFVLAFAKEVLTIEKTADAAAARALISRHGSVAQSRWRDSSQQRTKQAGLPSRLVFLTPRLKALKDDKGVIVDATLVEPFDVIEAALLDAGKGIEN